MAKPKVDLTLIKKLIAELDTALLAADKMPRASTEEKNEWTIEMNKALGLASGIMSEGTFLVGDFQRVMYGGADSSYEDSIAKLLGGLKGPTNTN